MPMFHSSRWRLPETGIAAHGSGPQAAEVEPRVTMGLPEHD